MEERIPLADGRMVTADALVGTEFDVIAWRETDGAQVPRRARADWNRHEAAYRVRTHSGREIIRAAEHPLWSALAESSIKGGRAKGTVTLTPCVRGWTAVAKLQPDDLVLVPEQHTARGALPADPDDVALLGYLLGDGGTTKPGQVSFTQQDGAALDEFRGMVDRLGCDLYVMRSRPYHYVVRNLDTSHRPRAIGSGRWNPVVDRVRAWGLEGKGAREKAFPDWAWTLPNDQLAILLGRLMACDGNVYCKEQAGNRLMARVAITLASERMIRDVEAAMLRLAVWGYVRHRRIRYNGGFNDAWEWSCRDREALVRLAGLIDMPGKNEAMRHLVAAVGSRSTARTRSWPRRNAPAGYRWERVSEVEELPVTRALSLEVDEDHPFVTSYVEHHASAGTG
ncbi:hypothetical protein [Streptomyces sp. NPDC046727]|uniref:hypothetical protein n=1 Tax=Streptomyces sp. NPDC046727 TaxID=3155373 RepID=UPI0033DE9E75